MSEPTDRRRRAGLPGRRRGPGAELVRLPESVESVVEPVVGALPGLARMAGRTAWHTTEWGVRTYVRGWIRVGRAVVDREEAAALARDAGHGLAVVGELAQQMSAGTPVGKALLGAGQALGGLVEPAEGLIGTTVQSVNGQLVASRPEPPSLRDRGRELLERSRDVWSDDVAHPAYNRILEELAPDEARVLLLLLEKGPQPSVDVRTGGPVGMVSSALVAPGLNMIGARAGCRHVEQVPSYLNNLFRLGLVWFSREALKDPMEYQVVEAQPDVLTAMHSVRFAKVVRRSIHLTPFGEDFCRRTLVAEERSAESFPEHGTPGEADAAEGPSPSSSV